MNCFIAVRDHPDPAGDNHLSLCPKSPLLLERVGPSQLNRDGCDLVPSFMTL